MTALIVPKWIDEIISKYDASDRDFDAHEVRAELLASAPQAADVAPEEKLCAAAEVAALTFAPDAGATVWGTYFGPLASGTTGDGGQFFSPDVHTVPPPALDHWKHRAKTVSNPVLKARYADLVWDLGYQISCQKPDVIFAKLAIDGYLDYARKVEFANPLFQFPAAFRAYALAATLGDKEAVATAKNAIMQLHRATIGSEKPIWWMAFDFLINQPRKKVSAELAELARDLETVVEKSKAGAAAFDPHKVESASGRLIAYYNRAGDRDATRRLYEVAAQTHERHAAMGDAMLASVVLEKALNDYKSAGLPDEAERVRIEMEAKIRAARSEMQRISHEFKIERKDMDEFVASIVNDSPGLTFVRLAVEFLTSHSEVEKNLDAMAEAAPLMAVIRRTVMTDDHVSAVIGSVEDDRFGRLVEQAAQGMRIAGVWLSQALSAAVEKHDLLPEHFAAWTNRLGLYNDTACLVRGFRAWFDGDPIAALHVLVPQVELGLRKIVEKLGKPATKADINRPGVSTALGLGDILFNPEIAEALGPDMRLHYIALYADSRGLNLRNRVAHGLMTFDETHQGLVLLVVHSLLVFGIWDRIAEKRR
jgi:lysyl-tRNA synthetase class 1